MKYPIAELFHSIQGEGVWTGTPMLFVRLAGCNVGHYRPVRDEEAAKWGGLAAGTGLVAEDTFPILQAFCRTLDGREFLCDTDYHKRFELEDQEIVGAAYEHFVCVTGGEPFLHDLKPLERLCLQKVANGRYSSLHIETSGTLPIYETPFMWITCSPKGGFLEDNAKYVNEWKFLVDGNFDPEVVLRVTKLNPRVPVFIQPINRVDEVDEDNLQRCLHLLQQFPQWRLSVQLHKYLKVR